MSSHGSSSNGDGSGAGSWAYLPPGAFSGVDMPPGIGDAIEADMGSAPAPATPSPPVQQQPQRRVVSEPERQLAAPQQRPQPVQQQLPSHGALPLQPGGVAGRAPAVRQQRMGHHPSRAMMRPRAFGAEPAMVSQHLLGASTVLVGVGSLLGGHFGGLYGSISGALFAGSAINAVRASSAALQPDPEQKKQAQISAIYAIVGGAVGGYVWWKKAEPRRATANPRSRQAVRRNEPRNCGSRPIGP